MRKAVLVQYSGNMSGSALSGQLVAEALTESGLEVHIVFGFHGPIVDQLIGDGYHVHVVAHNSWLRTTDPLRFARNLKIELSNSKAFRGLFSKLRPQLVYVNSLVSLAPIFAARQLGIPSIWHVRELFSNIGGEMEAPGILGRAVAKHIVNSMATELITVSNAALNSISLRSQKHRWEIVPNAVRDDFFWRSDAQSLARKKLGLPDGVPLIGVPGTLRPAKGHPFFISAFPAIRKAIPSSHVAITGGCDVAPAYSVQLKDLVRQLGATDCFHFVGNVRDMISFYRACDVVVVPSISESFGRTIIEAFACEVPVIATSVSGINEIIRDTENGYAVPYGDDVALANAAIKLLEDSSSAAPIVAAARKDAETHYRAELFRRRISSLALRTIGEHLGSGA